MEIHITVHMEAAQASLPGSFFVLQKISTVLLTDGLQGVILN